MNVDQLANHKKWIDGEPSAHDIGGCIAVRDTDPDEAAYASGHLPDNGRHVLSSSIDDEANCAENAEQQHRPAEPSLVCKDISETSPCRLIK